MFGKLFPRAMNQGGWIAPYLAVLIVVMSSMAYFGVSFTGAVESVKKVFNKSVSSERLNSISKLLIANAADVEPDGFLEVWAVRGASSLPYLITMGHNDEFGVEIRYCAWDLGQLNASAPEFTANNVAPPIPDLAARLISAGKNKTFQTTCTSLTAGGDDIMVDIYHKDLVAYARSFPTGSNDYPLDPWTKLLLRGDGQHGSRAINDSSIWNHAVLPAGNAAISTTQSKYGGSSISFDGSSWLSVSDNIADFHFGNGDFTIDTWVYPTSWTANPTGIVDTWSVNAFSVSGWYLQYTNGTIAGGLASGTTPYSVSAASSLPVNTWSHVALVRQGTTLYLFKNGALLATNAVGAVSANSPTTPVTIGAYAAANSSAVSRFAGFIDELRVSKGIARWTMNFTPPGTPITGNDTFTCTATGFTSREQQTCNTNCATLGTTVANCTPTYPWVCKLSSIATTTTPGGSIPFQINLSTYYATFGAGCVVTNAGFCGQYTPPNERLLVPEDCNMGLYINGSYQTGPVWTCPLSGGTACSGGGTPTCSKTVSTPGQCVKN